MNDTTLRKKFEAAISAVEDCHLGRDDNDVYLFYSTRLLWNAVRIGNRVWEPEHIAACYLMLQLLDSIEATGGLIDKGSYIVPAADEEWSDLGDVIFKMLGFLQRNADLPTDIFTITKEEET